MSQFCRNVVGAGMTFLWVEGCVNSGVDDAGKGLLAHKKNKNLQISKQQMLASLGQALLCKQDVESDARSKMPKPFYTLW